MQLEKYSFGIGDRFGQQGTAQLRAFYMARERDIHLVPVWNKSDREHTTIQSVPADTRIAADEAVVRTGWEGSYYVDADHIHLSNVDPYIRHADFFTIDVAGYIGEKATENELHAFVEDNLPQAGVLHIPGIEPHFVVTREVMRRIAEKFLFAIGQAGIIYRHIAENKGEEGFVTEISMDEVEDAQDPVELFYILRAIASEGIPVQTIAPKFSGRFNKGIDFRGDVARFAVEFEQHLLVTDHAVKCFGLPSNLKLSVHSGSDKFSIYQVIGQMIRKHDKGIHIKTAGTTWLEEVIGLSLAGGDAFRMVSEIYTNAYDRFDELCSPYAQVLDIEKNRLPLPKTVRGWDGDRFAAALRHVPDHPEYNSHLRQLMHVSYKVAAELGNAYIDMLARHHTLIARQVTENIFERHIQKIFVE